MNTEEMKEKIEENTLSQIISNYFRRIIFQKVCSKVRPLEYLLKPKYESK